jgi:nucleoside-diphosphate-sugar epimerase
VFFQMGSKRFVPLAGPPDARAAMIHVDDLTALLAALLREQPRGAVLTAADGRPEGYSWREVFRTAALAVGNPAARLFHAPAVMLHAIALAGDLGRIAGSASMLSHQKLGELRHRDWSVSAAELARPAGWLPRYQLTEGFGQTVAWYRRAGWL